MKLYQYIIKRLILMIFVLFGVSIIIFYLCRGFPTSLPPWTAYISPNMKPAQIEAMKIAHGFDKPLPIQYFYWLRDVLKGNWGLTGIWANCMPANKVFFRHFPYTVELAVTAAILAMIIGVPLGIISALKSNKLPDHISRIISLVGYSTPAYWFGFMLQLVFFYYFYLWGLPYLPSGGATGMEGIVPKLTGMPVLDGILAGNLEYTWDAICHLILPAFSLSFISLGFLARMVRASMLEILRQDYITLARSKGLKERVVIYRHALKNALIPVVTLAGIFFAGLLGGSAITEFVFSWPGVGQQALKAISEDDSNFILIYTLVCAFIVVTANLAVDILYVFLDPRIKY